MSPDNADEQRSPRLTGRLNEPADTKAALMGRIARTVASPVLNDNLACREPRIDSLVIAVAAADAGEFASDDELLAMAARYA